MFEKMMLRNPLGRYTILLPLAAVGIVARYIAHVAGLGPVATALVELPAIGIALVLLSNPMDGRPTFSPVDIRTVAVAVIAVTSALVSTLVYRETTLSAAAFIVLQTAITAAAIIYVVIYWRRG